MGKKTIVLPSLLLPSSPLPIIDAEKENGNQAFIHVSVATLWIEPYATRPIDEPVTENPVHMRKWVESMDLKQKLQLSEGNKLGTQALLGVEVTILERGGDWIKVAVHGQPTPKSKLGYPGWVSAKQLTYNKKFTDKKGNPFVLIKKLTAFVSFDKDKTLEVSYGTQLPFLSESKDCYFVILPDGKKAKVKKTDGKVYALQESILVSTADDLINDAKQFLRVPYIWGGRSAFGVDCSGFMQILFQAHGITIPRDSGPIAKAGTFVDKDHLQKGDVLYFAYNKGKGKVHHVALYMGEGMMIHSPGAERAVEIIPLDCPPHKYNEELVGGRRFLKQ